MIEQTLRSSYQHYFVNPVANKIKHHLSPQQATIIGGVLGILTFPALVWHGNYLAISLLLASGYLDTLDGTLARLQHQTTDLGAIYDIVTDRCVEFAVVMGLWSIQPDERSPACLLMLGSMLLCITSFLAAGIFTPNNSDKSFYYSPGIMERAEAFIFFILMIALPTYFMIFACLFIVLVFMTAMIRIYEFSLNQNG